MSIVKNPPFPKNYANEFLVLKKGRGSYIWDEAGKKYLDFAAGIAVNSLGYGAKEIEQAAIRQLKDLIHVSNLFTTRPALDLAEMLTAASPLPKDQPWRSDFRPGYFAAVHFGNSGSEANEGALKYAKMSAGRKERPNGRRILAFKNGFHGRTLGALSVTHTEKYRKPYEPLIEGIEFAEYNDAAAVRALVSSEFTAVIVEPVQGEGGLTVMSPDFAAALNETCRKHDVVLIADEIQTGIGRTGTLFASESLGLEPDIVTLSKPLAGGLPLSATLIPKTINDLVQVGDHGTTFGGGPVTTAVAAVIWKKITSPGFLEGVRAKAAELEDGLSDLAGSSDRLGALRGLGMLRGVEVRDPELLPRIIEKAREKGLLVLRSGANILRMAPPLTVGRNELYDGLRILRSAVEEA